MCPALVGTAEEPGPCQCAARLPADWWQKGSSVTISKDHGYLQWLQNNNLWSIYVLRVAKLVLKVLTCLTHVCHLWDFVWFCEFLEWTCQLLLASNEETRLPSSLCVQAMRGTFSSRTIVVCYNRSRKNYTFGSIWWGCWSISGNTICRYFICATGVSFSSQLYWLAPKKRSARPIAHQNVWVAAMLRLRGIKTGYCGIQGLLWEAASEKLKVQLFVVQNLQEDTLNLQPAVAGATVKNLAILAIQLTELIVLDINGSNIWASQVDGLL